MRNFIGNFKIDLLDSMSPILIQDKLIMQEIWTANLNLDDPLPINLRASVTRVC